ncbi:MAG TPA: DUF2330 domain-containing protein [Polyangium sp.]|nr:DUF2330 domain-containing protein [Polyangium sp.]
MLRTSRFLMLAGASMLAVSGLVTSDAQACGGCFHEENPPGPEISVVTGHRMAFAISPAQTVLWDQVEYSGSPAEFAWVLPVKPGAHLELASDAWFNALDAATSTRVLAPSVNCAPFNGGDFFEGGGDDFSGLSCCGSMSDASGGMMADGTGTGGGVDGVPQQPPPVEVVDRATVGPYEVLTLQANVPGVLVDWLKMNGFAADASIQPVIDQYQAEGFDFIAMKLKPNVGVQSMKPVRVVSPGASPALPLRMVAAGTGAETAVTLFVIGEGRWQPENFPNVAIPAVNLTWDYASSSSDYASRRLEFLAQNEGRSWLSTYAHVGGLLSQINNSQGTPSTYQTNTGTVNTIAQFFTVTAYNNSETSDPDCAAKFGEYATSMDMVVDLCTDPNMPCADVMPGQIDSRVFECAPSFDQPDVPLNDLKMAMLGQHPASVWLTRIEGNLSRKALETDLTLAPEEKQAEIDNWIVPGRKANVPCQEVAPSAMIPPDMDARHDRRKRRELAAALLGLFGLCSALARRAAKSIRPAMSRA